MFALGPLLRKKRLLCPPPTQLFNNVTAGDRNENTATLNCISTLSSTVCQRLVGISTPASERQIHASPLRLSGLYRIIDVTGRHFAHICSGLSNDQLLQLSLLALDS